MQIKSSKCVAIVSGGLDSSGLAAYFKTRGSEIYILTFNYGQRASKEIDRAKEIGTGIGASDHKIIDISFMKSIYGDTNVLTDSTLEMPKQFQSNIIVPIRNAIFLTIATAYAFSLGAGTVGYGAHLSDQPYPDCRPEFARSLSQALNLGDIDAIKSLQHPEVSFWSPAIAGMGKADMLKLSFDILGDRIYRTWSCYQNMEKQCGICESCNNRKKAFQLAGIPDRTEYT